LLRLILGFYAILGFQVVNQGSALAYGRSKQKLRDFRILPFTENAEIRSNLNSILSGCAAALETGSVSFGGAFQAIVLTLIFLPVISLYMAWVDDAVSDFACSGWCPPDPRQTL